MLCTPSCLYAQQTWVCSNLLFLLVPVGVCAEQPLHAAHNIEWIRQRRTQWLSETPRETPTHGLYKSLPLRSRFHSWSKGNRTENLWHPKSTVVWFLLDVSIYIYVITCNYYFSLQTDFEILSDRQDHSNFLPRVAPNCSRWALSCSCFSKVAFQARGFMTRKWNLPSLGLLEG